MNTRKIVTASEFKELPVEEQRILIVNEAIKILEDNPEFFVPQAGDTMHFSGRGIPMTYHSPHALLWEMLNLAEKEGARCHLCIRGMLFLTATLETEANPEWGDLRLAGYAKEYYPLDQELMKYWTFQQIQEMEYVFERMMVPNNGLEFEDVAAFFEGMDDRQLMLNILYNMRDNGGILKLPGYVGE